jgi:3-phenylpropionate/trans-cinnamate dioxygenase ferredoxin subunit
MFRWIEIYNFGKHGLEVHPDGSLRVIDIDGKKLCLIRQRDTYYALDNKCPHAGASLGQGWCEENYLVCPIHRFKYDINTGKGAVGQGDFINTYPVKLENNKLWIGLKKNAWWQIW